MVKVKINVNPKIGLKTTAKLRYGQTLNAKPVCKIRVRSGNIAKVYDLCKNK